MPDTEPEIQGPLLALLEAPLKELSKLNALVAYSPGVSNRSDHLETIQDGIEDLVAIIPDVNPPDPPSEGS